MEPGDISRVQQHKQYKCLIFIAMLYIALMLGSAIMVNRVLDFDSFTQPGGILIFPLTYFLSDVITEIYGYRISRNILWSSLICQFIFAIVISLTMLAPTAPFIQSNTAFHTVLDHLIKYSISFTLGTIAGGFLNIYIISKFKIIMQGKYFWLRSLGSTCLGECVFTIITLGPVLLANNTLAHVLQILLDAYIFKLIYGLLFIIPASILVVILKRVEKIDTYDYQVKYNPFSLRINQTAEN